MFIEKLNQSNVEYYIEYLIEALETEPEMMTIDAVDEKEIRKHVSNGTKSTSLLAIENNHVLGRLEYHFYDCIQDGYKMAYVNWLYVAKKYRHQGIAQALFHAFEEECKANGINEYFLIQAKNQNADHFYHSFEDAQTIHEKILRKIIQ